MAVSAKCTEQWRNEMAARPLPEHLVEAGATLLAALDDAGLQPQGAAWIFDHALGADRLTSG
jgi:hypothetical protein